MEHNYTSSSTKYNHKVMKHYDYNCITAKRHTRLSSAQSNNTRCATKIKITIRSVDKDGRTHTFNPPRISLRFAGGAIKFALRFVVNRNDNVDPAQVREAIHEAIELLKNMPPFELISVEEPEENTYVHVYTCR